MTPTNSAPTDSPAASANGAFGATRGSGLARGKRPTTPASNGAASAPVGYQPTALEVIKPQSEYKNPFTGETTTPTPVVNEPAPQAAPTAPAPAAAPAPVSAAPTSAPAPAAADSKAELNILPPEPARRPAVSWEAAAPAPAPRRDERPTFQPRDRREGDRREGGDRRDSGERRERREGGERRDGGERREGREGRSFEPRPPREHRDDRRGESRPQPAPAAAPSEEKKSGGFFGWLKGLFGGKKKPAEPQGERHHGHGGHRHDHRGPRPEGSEQDGDGQRRRRRRRGGRGRNRGEGGEGGNRGPRPEGQQGGGAI